MRKLFCDTCGTEIEPGTWYVRILVFDANKAPTELSKDTCLACGKAAAKKAIDTVDGDKVPKMSVDTAMHYHG